MPSPQSTASKATSPEAAKASPSRQRLLILALLILVPAIFGGVFFASRYQANPDQIWQEAQQALRDERIDIAEAKLAKLTKLRAPNPFDWMLRAQVAMARGEVDASLVDLEKVYNDPKLGSQARLMAGQLELRRHRLRYAEKAFLGAIEFDPKQIQAHRELVYIYGVQLRRKELNEQFRALSQITPLTYDNVFHWCLTRNTMWEPLELSQMMARFIQEDPDDRWSRLSLAESLRGLGRRDEVEKALAPLPATDPDARAIRVRLALDRGDDKTAEALLKEGPADHPELARLRGRMALARNDGAAALKFFRLAYAAEPDNRDTAFGMAGALALVGQKDEAAKFRQLSRDFDRLGSLMQKASTASGRNDTVLLRDLGAACEAINRLPEARSWYNLLITRDPLDKEAQQALFRVDSAIKLANANTPGK